MHMSWLVLLWLEISIMVCDCCDVQARDAVAMSLCRTNRDGLEEGTYDVYPDDAQEHLPTCVKGAVEGDNGCDCVIYARRRDASKPVQQVELMPLAIDDALSRVFDYTDTGSAKVYQISDGKFRGTLMHEVNCMCPMSPLLFLVSIVVDVHAELLV